MPVPVMNVGVVGVRMNQWRVSVRVAVGFAEWIDRGVGVLVMFVVGVQMVVLHRFMLVLVLVTLGQMQPHAQRHENCGETETEGEPVAQEQNRNGRADERRDGKICAASSRPNVPERENE